LIDWAIVLWRSLGALRSWARRATESNWPFSLCFWGYNALENRGFVLHRRKGGVSVEERCGTVQIDVF